MLNQARLCMRLNLYHYRLIVYVFGRHVRYHPELGAVL